MKQYVRYRIDKHCHFCKRELAKCDSIPTSLGIENDANGLLYLATYTTNLREGILLLPDYNSCGYLTHWHIEHLSAKQVMSIKKEGVA